VTPLVLIWLAVFGLVIGSFLNVCIGRLPPGESVVLPSSRCPSCRTGILWYDNIPVLSYLRLKGRCRACHVRISPRYPAVEVITSLAFVIQGLWFWTEPVMLVDRLVFTSMLIVLFGTDLDTQRLPNVLTLPGIVIGAVFSVWVPPGLAASLLGAAAGAGVLLAVRWGWKRATGVDGMGLGDVKMLAMIGAFLGWRQVGIVLFIASLSGAIVGIALAASGRRSLSAKLPFGTFSTLSRPSMTYISHSGRDRSR